MTSQSTSHHVFQQVCSRNRETRFMTKFGRNKTMSFRRHDETGYFYLDLYHNKFRGAAAEHMCFGMGEMETLIELFGNLETLKKCFPKPPVDPAAKNNQVRPTCITPPAGFTEVRNGPVSTSYPIQYEAVRAPFQHVQSSVLKRPVSADGFYKATTKVSRLNDQAHQDCFGGSNITQYENVSPPRDEHPEEMIPEEVLHEYVESPLPFQ
ncbi:unnamed protein product [Mytilus coruscus]|uniref:Uncharacterized protein n=1 Tax=Mytilus coruscus TaxID=42192 RepID=A0A6J8C4M5_MYTCO|nr:unnamed protein product [Mytilus coruscus]